MRNLLPHSRIKYVNDDGTPSREFFNYLRDLEASQIPIGGIIQSLSPTPPKGYLAFGSTFSQTDYPDLYALLGTNQIPSVEDGLYLASVSGSLVGSVFGSNTVGLLHLHTAKIVASGTGASVSGDNSGNLVQADNRPRTLGVNFYVRAE